MSNRDFIMKIGGSVDPSLTKSFNQSSQEVKKLSDQMKKMKDTNFSKSAKEVEKLSHEMRTLKTTSREISKLEEKSKKLEDQFKQSRNSYSEQQRSLFEMTQKTKDLKKVIDQTSKPTKKMVNEFKKAKLAEDKLRDSTDKERKSLTDMMRKMKSVKQESNKYGASQEDLAKQISQVSKRQHALAKSNEMTKRYKEQIRLSKEMKKALHQENQERFKQFRDNNKEKGKSSLYKGAGQAVAMGVGIKFAVDDESAFADVKKQLTLTDEGEIQKFRQELLKTTETIPLMNNEIYEIAAAAGRAGIAQEELTKFTFDTAKVAVAFGVDAEEAGSNLATWRTSLNMSQKEVMGLADQINVLGDNINVTPKQVGDIVTAMGPLGKIANVTAAQTATLGASLIDFGVKDASTASTALRKLYSTMSAGNAASSTKKSAFQALGFDPVQISEDMQKDSMGTIQKVMGAFKNLSESEKLSVGTQLFGEEAVGALLPLSQHLDKISNNLKMVNDKQKVANSVGKEFANVNKTAAAQLKISQRAILNLSLGFTNTMLPAIQSATKGVTSFTNGMNSLTTDHPQMTKAISYGAATLVGLRLASGGARLGLEQVFKMKDDYKTFMAAGNKIKEWKQWGPMLSKIKVVGGSTFKMLGKGAMAFGRLALANPWIIAIAAIAAGAYLVYKNWDKVKEGFSVVKAKITELWDKFKESPIGKIFAYSPLGLWIKGIKKLYSYWKKFKGEKENPLKTPGLNKSGIKTNVPAYAKGGIMTTPHLAIVGDAPETIVPHDGTEQSKNLWYSAGNKLGMFAGKGIPALASNVKEKSSKTNIENKFELKIDHKPTIIGNIDNIDELLKNSNEELVKLVEELMGKIMSKNTKLERRVSLD